MEEQEFQNLLKNKTTEIENILKKYLPEERGYQKTVLEAMNYSLLAGGKRLRPMMMQEVYHMFGGSGRVIEPFMAALEMIHTYSLVHDDLPAMDNDEYRRGRETTWKVYGEGMGVLAGDGLLNLAFETALSAFELLEQAGEPCRVQEQAGEPCRVQEQAGEPCGVQEQAGEPCRAQKQAGEPCRIQEQDMYRAVAKALRVLAHKAGVYGMIGGQTADMEAEGQEMPLTEERLLYIHENKTAALVQAAMMIGAILAGAGEREVAAMEKCAYNVGIAFQIQDDILDVAGDSGELGKMVGSDAQNHKQTYVTINGLEQSGRDVERLSREAVEILKGVGGGHAFLEQLILALVNRRS